MVRPVEFPDLTSTCVKVERNLLDQAKHENVNISAVLREALRKKLKTGTSTKNNVLRKFRGLPRHVVNKAKNNVIEDVNNAPLTANWLQDQYGAEVSENDVLGLVPMF